MEDLALSVLLTLCVMLLIAMLGFGPWVLEWIEGAPRETLVRRPPHGGPRLPSRRAVRY